MAKKWIGKAIKHPGRLIKAAAAAGVSKLQQAEKWSHSSDPSKRGAGLLGKRFIKGSLDAGGTVPHDVQVSGRSYEAAHSMTENMNQKHGITGDHKHHLLENPGSRMVKKSDVGERHVTGA